MSHDDLDLDTLRSAFAEDGPPAGECPSPEQLWAGTRGALSPAERDALLDHIAACPACTEDWRLATAFAREADASGEAEVVPLRRPDVRRAVPWLTAALAASLLLVAGVELHQQRQERSVVAERGGETARLGSPLDGSVLLRTRPVLRWYGAAGARYDVEVMTAELQRIAGAHGLTRPEYRIPAGALAGLPAGSKLHWRVDADLPGGERVRSDTFVTELR
jgi:hypothetical protein